MGWLDRVIRSLFEHRFRHCANPAVANGTEHDFQRVADLLDVAEYWQQSVHRLDYGLAIIRQSIELLGFRELASLELLVTEVSQ